MSTLPGGATNASRMLISPSLPAASKLYLVTAFRATGGRVVVVVVKNMGRWMPAGVPQPAPLPHQWVGGSKQGEGTESTEVTHTRWRIAEGGRGGA